jgi:hypothetical protein
MSGKVTVVTSFSEDGWHRYAKEMIESVDKYWSKDIKVKAYYHDFDLMEFNPPESNNIEYRYLNELEELRDFKESHKEYDGTMGGKTTYSYQMDAIKFCHKVFAIGECAFTQRASEKNPDWLVWLDADTITKQPVTMENFQACLDDSVSLVHLGRKHMSYSETSFIGMNLNHQTTIDFIGDFLGAYLSGEVINYREWHDGFIFERLLTIYKAHGLKFKDWTGHVEELVSKTKGQQAFEMFPLGLLMEHQKGDRKKGELLPPATPENIKVSGGSELRKVPIVVQPVDCVPKETIQNNVKKNTRLIKKWVKRAQAHDEMAVLISGGDSTDWDKVKSIIAKDPENTKVVCVKHSYPKLLENGIQPWGCIVLDPRSINGVSTHGVKRKELFKNVDDKTIFFPASMTDPSIVRFLKKRTKNIIGWHAFTQTLQDDIKDQVVGQHIKVSESLGIEEGAMLITGGTCAAMRAISIMHTIGFRKFELFGYDCSVDQPENEEELTPEGKRKYLKVGVGDSESFEEKDKYFWTTGELLAMAQDCEKTFEKENVDLRINFHGEDTLVAALWKQASVNRLKPYQEVLGIGG